MKEYKHVCTSENADKILKWMNERGGIALWRSVNLSNPGASWTTPATIRRGDCDGPAAQEGSPDDILPYPKPTWQCANEPEIIKDKAEVGVSFDREVKRFHVGLRRGGQGLSIKCTDAASRRIRQEVEQAGDGAYHRFDYETQEAVIMAPDKVMGLVEYEQQKGK